MNLIKPTETDEDLVLEYLGCKVTERDGVTELSYVEGGSDRETECLRAGCRLLRGNQEISNIIRWRMASLFDPDATVEACHIVIQHRGAPPAQEAR